MSTSLTPLTHRRRVEQASNKDKDKDKKGQGQDIMIMLTLASRAD